MITIREVTTKQERKLFVDYPNRLYRDVPQFVPATFDDDMSDWDREKNPAFAYCDARCWLAWRDNEIVGRIGAILSMRFTQVDFIDDREVSAALFGTVEQWAAEMGCNEVHGPLGFTDLDREGMLVEGFDRRSCFFTYYNHPYYIDHLTALGYGKDVDWIENYITVPDDKRTLDRWRKISDFVLRRYRLHIFNARTRLDYIPMFGKFFRLVNKAYAPLYGTVELSEEQIKRYTWKFGPLVNPKLTCFVMDENEEMVALGVGAPSIASALQRSRGRYFPFGWADLLHSFVKNDTIDLLLIGVDPKYQGKGVNAVVINKVLHGCVEMGIKYAETGPMLETNDKVQSQWADVKREQHKRRRCFIKRLPDPPAAEEDVPAEESAPAEA
jgi:GNAT superfamily N-acetyltransferase